jgi:hypothetical protein
LTHQNEWSTPDNAKPLKGFIRPVSPKIPYAKNPTGKNNTSQKNVLQKRDQKYWPLINGYPEIMAELAIGPDAVTGEVATSHHFSDF